MSKRVLEVSDDVPESERFQFIALGGGNEVGRSCHIIEYMGKVVMLDAGVHPAYTGIASLPFYDEYDLSKVDILLISHFHLDHAASLPYVMQHTTFKGRVFMTHPTKAIYRWLLNDFIRVTDANDNSMSGNSKLFSGEDHMSSVDRIESIDYHQTMNVDGIKFTALHAGHVLGAAMYLIEIGDVRILFTGDYSREEDRHLNQAEVPPVRPDIMICESTFGTATHEPRAEKELRMTNLIHSTINKGGRVLMPVFALGNAQELLLLLEEYWDMHIDLEHVPIYYASALARKCLAVYQTYLHTMNERIQQALKEKRGNPFNFKHITNIKRVDQIDDIDPCVVIAAPGMLQNGISREILERWAPDDRNSLIITGYSVEGTMAKSIISEPDQIPSVNNPDVMIPRRIKVDEISFAAHVDYEQNSKFIELVNPKCIILVHGESNPMGRLKSALLSKYSKFKNTEKEVRVFNPRNCEDLELTFRGDKVVKAIGKIADVPYKEGQIISGVLVQKDFRLSLLDPTDLRDIAGLTTTVIKERQTVRVDAGRDLILYHLNQMFGHVEILSQAEEALELNVMESVGVTVEGNQCTIEWVGSVLNDTVADSVLAILLSVDSSPASLKVSSKGACSHHHEGDHADSSPETRIKKISAIMRAQFGDCYRLNEDLQGAVITMNGQEAKITFSTLEVNCSQSGLASRISHVLKRAVNLTAPLAHKIQTK